MSFPSQLAAAAHPQFGEDAVQVALHRDSGNEQPLGDLRISQVFADKTRYSAFGWRKALLLPAAPSPLRR